MSSAPSHGRRARRIVVRRKPGDPARALVAAPGFSAAAAIGRSGITALKREGDGATPRASMRLIEGFYRSDRMGRPPTALPMRPIRADMGWCDAPFNASYNRLVRLPFGPSHENLMRDDHLYDIVLVIDWNIRERKAGAGSAIFMHLARPGYQPTEGCIALSRGDMLRLLTLVDRATVVRVP